MIHVPNSGLRRVWGIKRSWGRFGRRNNYGVVIRGHVSIERFRLALWNWLFIWGCWVYWSFLNTVGCTYKPIDAALLRAM